MDYAGVVALTAGLTAFVLALVEGNAWGWSSPEIIALFAGGILLLVAFVAIELRVRAPMIEFEFFRNREFLGASAVAFIVSFAMLGMFFFMALYMQNILGYSPLEAGVRFLPSTLMIVIIAPLAGRLTDRIGPRPPIVAGLAIVTVSLYLQSLVGVDTGYGQLLLPFVLMGIGIALVMSPMSTAAMNAVDVAKSGLASGILSMLRMVGGTFGVAVLGAIFQAETGSAIGGAPALFVDALGISLKIGAAVTLLGAVIGALTLSGSVRRTRIGDAAAETAAAEAAAGGADIAVERAALR